MRGDYKRGEERKGEKKVRKARLEVQRNREEEDNMEKLGKNRV